MGHKTEVEKRRKPSAPRKPRAKKAPAPKPDVVVTPQPETTTIQPLKVIWNAIRDWFTAPAWR